MERRKNSSSRPNLRYNKTQSMKWKLWLNLATFAALGLIIFIAWPDIERAFGYFKDLNLWILLLIVPLQFLVYAALAQFFKHFFAATGTKLTFKQLFAPMLELNFVNHVFPSGGVSGFSYLTLRLRQYNVSTAKSTLAQLARFAFTFVAFTLLLLVALVFLAVEGKASSLVVLAASTVTFTILFGTAVLIFVIGSRSRIASFTHTMARWLNKAIHIVRPKRPETISLKNVEQIFLELHEDYLIIRHDVRGMRKVMLWAILVDLAELSLLYVVFLAFGAEVNPGAIIVAFVFASLAGFVAILPGGIGVYEPLMAALLISGGVPAPLALGATLVFRVLSLLLSLLSGYFLYHRALRKYGTANLPSQPIN